MPSFFAGGCLFIFTIITFIKKYKEVKSVVQVGNNQYQQNI